MKTIMSWAVFTAIVVGMTCRLRADGTWTGAADGFWTNATNWAEGKVPGRYYEPDGTLAGVKTDTAVFGAVTAGAATVIDFDGVRAISNLVVTGAAAPAYTFGTSADQAIALEECGQLWVKADAAHAPTMVGFLVLGRDAAIQTYRMYTTLVNDSAEELVINGFGYLELGTTSALAPRFQGTGDMRLTGPFVRGTTGTGTASCRPYVSTSGGRLTLDVDWTLYDLVAEKGAAKQIDITAGHTLTFDSPSPINMMNDNVTFGGAGTVAFAASNSDITFTIWAGKTCRFDARVTTPNLTSPHVLNLYCNGYFIFTNPQNAITGDIKTSPVGGSAQWILSAEAADIGVKGHAGMLGSGSLFDLTRACVKYTGAGETMDRDIRLRTATTAYSGNNSEEMVFWQAGAGVWRITSQILSTESATPFLRLKGGASAAGVWAGAISNGNASANLSLIKSDAGTWRLDATNAYTGATTVEAGVLELGTAGSIAASSELVLKGGTFSILSDEAARTVVLPAVRLTSGASILRVGDGVSVTLAGVVRTEAETGTLNILMPDDSSRVTVTGWEAGAATPAYVTLNGSSATVGSDGALVQDGVTAWKAAADGDWNVAANWTAGVPDGTKQARIGLRGASYGVTVPAGVTAGAGDGIFVRNDQTDATTTLAVGGRLELADAATTFATGSRLAVAADGEVVFDNHAARDISYAGTDLTFENGSSAEIKGTLLLTNATGTVAIGDGGDGSGVTLTVDGGLFAYAPRRRVAGTSNSSLLKWNAGSRVVATNGGIISVTSMNSGYSMVADGATFDFFDTSSLQVAPTRDEGSATENGWPHVRFGNASLTFHGDATFNPQVGTKDSNIRIMPYGAGGISRMTFLDASCVVKRGGTFLAGGVDYADGAGILTFASSATHTENGLGHAVRIGSGRGYGEMNVTAGTVYAGSYGLSVADYTTGGESQATVTGVVNVTGGKFSVGGRGSYEYGWAGDIALYGTLVGNGAKSAVRGRRGTVGRLNLSGGTFENLAGYLIVGYGPTADGRIVQTGGSFESVLSDNFIQDRNGYVRYATNNMAVVGLAGGKGAFIVSNGTARVNTRLFVGGMVTNEFINTWQMGDGRFLTEYTNACRFADCDRISEGTLAVVGGTFTSTKDIVVGADGAGTLEIGPAGALAAEALVLSNRTSSVTRFVFGANGVGSVSVRRLAIAAGAKLTVDLTAWTALRGSTRLIRAEAIEGAFASADVELVGTAGRSDLKTAQIRQDETGVMLKLSRGTVVLFR